jgi:nitronate monooxygenase
VTDSLSVQRRVRTFTDRFELALPILLAPMAGVDVPHLSAAVSKAGGMGACGALLMTPEKIAAWANDFRNAGGRVFQMNLWAPDPEPLRDPAHEQAVRGFLEQWGPPVPENAGDQRPPDFDAQFDAIIAERPTAVSSIMGLYAKDQVARLKAEGIAWFATATTVAEARAAEAAGADAIVAEGMEAGGHRGAFDAGMAEDRLVGSMALIPAIADAVSVPVIAAGGISDARAIAAALLLGASAVEIGTGFLRTPEAAIPSAWADRLAATFPEDTMITRAFSGRAGRSIRTAYASAAAQLDAPPPAPYPVQRGLTGTMRAEAARANDIDRMQAWAGQSAGLAAAEPAGRLTERLWREAAQLLGWPGEQD